MSQAQPSSAAYDTGALGATVQAMGSKLGGLFGSTSGRSATGPDSEEAVVSRAVPSAQGVRLVIESADRQMPAASAYDCSEVSRYCHSVHYLRLGKVPASRRSLA